MALKRIKLTNGTYVDIKDADAYVKPSGGIPASDLASGVIPTVPTISTDISSDATSDTKTTSPKAVKTFVEGKGYGTYSKPSGGIPNSDLASPSPFVSGTGTNSAVMDGNSNVAAGPYSTAEGYSSETGGNATGYKPTAGGSTTSGSYAHAEGNSTIAKGLNSHAEGKQTFASGNNSHAEGFKTRALSNQAHAEGNNTEAAGSYSHAEGNRTYTGSAAYASHVEGGFCKAYGQAAHAEGYGACARANYSHAEAFNSFFFVYVTGSANATSYSFTINEASVNFNELGQTNYNNIFIGNIIFVNESSDAVEITGFSGSLSDGNYVGTLTVNKTLSTNALANQQCLVPATIALVNAHAEGRAAIAAGETSHAEGLHTNTKNGAEHAEGKYNKSNTHSTDTSKQTLHSVGCGDSDTHMNAFEIMQNGDVYVKGVGGYDGTNAGDRYILDLRRLLHIKVWNPDVVMEILGEDYENGILAVKEYNSIYTPFAFGLFGFPSGIGLYNTLCAECTYIIEDNTGHEIEELLLVNIYGYIDIDYPSGINYGTAFAVCRYNDIDEGATVFAMVKIDV